MKKKILSVFLAVLMLFMCLVPAFANEKCDCDTLPVVQVYGFGSPLSQQLENGKTVSLFSAKTIAEAIVPAFEAMGELLLKGDSVGFEKKAAEICNILFGKLTVDENLQHSVTLVNTATSDPTVDKHTGTDYSLTAVTVPNTDEYGFRYDWSLDPVTIATQLHEYIKTVKNTTGHDQIVLSAHSMGNCVIMAYLSLYGTSEIAKIIDLCGAYQGLSLVGQMFTGDIDLTGNGQALYEFLLTLLGTYGMEGAVTGVISKWEKMGILDEIADSLAIVVNEAKEDMFNDIFRPLFAHIPGVWSFVPDEYFEDAVSFMFGDKKEENKNLLSVIYRYHDTVQVKVVDLLKKAKENGVSVSIVCGYGCAPIPVSQNKYSQGDMLIDTKYTSLGATTAPYGSTLPVCNCIYLSPDYLVDADTCAFPENTWFIKYQDHNDFCEPFTEFYTWLILHKGEPNVFENEDYPQFMICKEHKSLEPVEIDDDIHNDAIGLLARLYAKCKLFVITVIAKIKSKLGI